MKKIFCLALSLLTLCCTASTTVLADNNVFTPSSGITIQPRFSDFDMVYATMYKSSSGFYHVEGGAATSSATKWVEITLTIEGCQSDGKYYPVDGLKWNATGYTLAATQATRDLPGGAYRAHTVAKCYQNGVLLETVEAYSNIVNVPY